MQKSLRTNIDESGVEIMCGSFGGKLICVYSISYSIACIIYEQSVYFLQGIECDGDDNRYALVRSLLISCHVIFLEMWACR